MASTKKLYNIGTNFSVDFTVPVYVLRLQFTSSRYIQRIEFNGAYGIRKLEHC